MARNTLFMETTNVLAAKSAAEITESLVTAGARSILTDYENGNIVGLNWTMRISGGEITFKMPARIDPVYKILLDDAKKSKRWVGNGTQKDALREKAERVAWRQLFRWVQAQMAMINCGMSEMTEVFFPYVQVPGGQSLFQLAKASQFKMLPAPDRQQ